MKGSAHRPSQSNQKYVKKANGSRVLNTAYAHSKTNNTHEPGTLFDDLKQSRAIRTDVDMDLNSPEYAFDAGRYEQESNDFIDKLDSNQKTAMYEYVISGYQDINEGLYNNGLTSELEVQARLIDSAIETYDGDVPDELWRNLSGFDLPSDFTDKNYQPGDTVTFHGFSSTSETPSGLGNLMSRKDWYMSQVSWDELKWKGEGIFNRELDIPDNIQAKNVVFRISGSHAAPVSMLRGKSTEQEWLIPRNREYVIEAVDENVTMAGGNQRANATEATIYTIREVPRE